MTNKKNTKKENKKDEKIKRKRIVEVVSSSESEWEEEVTKPQRKKRTLTPVAMVDVVVVRTTSI